MNKDVIIVGAIVETPEGKGKVENMNVLKERVFVKLENKAEQTAQEFALSDIKIIKNAHNDKEIEKIDEEILKTLEE